MRLSELIAQRCADGESQWQQQMTEKRAEVLAKLKKLKAKTPNPGTKAEAKWISDVQECLEWLDSVGLDSDGMPK